MKQIKLLLLTVLSLFIINSIAFTQDTTLTVTSDGMVGIGTSSPLSTLHVEGSIRAIGTIRTNQRFMVDNIGDLPNSIPIIFRSQGNEVGVIATYTAENMNGKLIFSTAQNGAMSDKMVIDHAGKVGIGTSSPEDRLHVTGSMRTNSWIICDNIGDLPNSMPIIFQSQENEVGRIATYTADNTNSKLIFSTAQNGAMMDRMYLSHAGQLGIGVNNPGHPIEMASGAHVTTGGVWTNASSKELKENIRDLTCDEAAQALSQLAPKRYNYKAEKNEEYLGFIAEDVPELVATGNRKSLSPMDIVAVLTKVVQEQQEKIAELEARLNSIQ